MFRDSKQRAEVCFILCAWVRDNPWRVRHGVPSWDVDRGSYRPRKVYLPEELDWSHSASEKAMILFAQALWDGGTLPIPLGVFDRRKLSSIGELLVAMSSEASVEAIDLWCIVRGATPAERVPSPRSLECIRRFWS